MLSQWPAPMIPWAKVYTVQKTIFSFSRRPEKMVFPKLSRWNSIFSVLSGSFSQKYDLTRRRKMKDDLSQKEIDGNKIFTSNVLKRWSFQNGTHWDMIFVVLLERWYFFPGNMVFFPWTENERVVNFLKKYSET